MKHAYLDKKLPQTYLPIIASANRVLEGYKRQGFDITLRGLYYQFIAQDLLPDSWIDAEYNAKNGLSVGTKNTQKNYKRLGGIIADARMVGLIDWAHLKDTGRQTDTQFHWDNYEGETPGEILRDRGNAFALHKWSNSPYHVEVMVEKDAIEGVVGPIAARYDCPFTSNRGYSSITAQRDSGLRLRRAMNEGKDVVVLYVGDHDPSGIDMTRELEYKLELFSGGGITMKRLALNMDQIDEYEPPPNPVKLNDSRAAGYVEQFGDDSWEVDALDAQVLADLVSNAIEDYVDQELLAVITAREEKYQRKMDRIADMVDTAMEDEDFDADDETGDDA
jgi:hypothetical protein